MKKLSALILIASLLMLIFASCSFFPSADRDDDNKSTTPIKIGYMNGPTGMGMAKLINDNGGVDGNDKYQFVKYSDASLATADLLSGKLDMACIPTNTAATLYNKSGKISVLALNCLNSLFIMTKTGTVINNVKDLEGKTIYTIQNGTPAAILKYLLSESGVNATVKTSIGEGENEKVIAAPTDLAPLLISGAIDIALVPEPVATAAPLKIASQNKDYTYTVAIDLTDAWSDISASPVAMGCIVANNDFLVKNKTAVNAFLDEYKASIEYIANASNREIAAKQIVAAGVLDAEAAAKKSLQNLGGAIAYSDGESMKSTLIAFYNSIGLKMIGSKLPDDNFYYEK